MQSLVRQVQVKNPLGLHTRPATAIVKLLQNCRSEITFTYKRKVINPKSILSILILAARKNAKITITISGSDAQEVMERLVEGFEKQFGE